MEFTEKNVKNKSHWSESHPLSSSSYKLRVPASLQ